MGRFFSILAVAVGCACVAAPAQADFGFSEFEISFTDQAGFPQTQAGAHPFAFTTSLEVNVDEGEPDGLLRDLFLDLAPGLLLDPLAVPRCLESAFETLDEGFNDCPGSSAVGVVSAAAGETGEWRIAPIYSLVPRAGELMRLGFRVGGTENILVSARTHPEWPHEMTLDIEGIPEAVELFGLELQLWGVPAHPANDSLRGRCAGPDGSLGECPTANAQRPLLTLPTRCGEPLEVSYLAESWDETTDSHGALTRDGLKNPQGLTGCGALSFNPEMSIQPTIKAAQDVTGLGLSLAFSDEGLVSPGGIAESQLRDLVLTLPEGMAVDSSAALGVCSEPDFEDEGPEDAAGEGCPDASEAGTLEVESPLLGADILAGSVYLGTPLSELAKGSPVVLYAVARNAALGVVIKQEIELEPDPATGQLVVYAEDLPQLPFSSLELDLFGGDSPLLTPARCGDHEIEMLLTPWAEDVDYRLLSEFSLDTGPGGGPCPSDAATEPSDHTDPPPAASAPPVASVVPPAVTRRKARRCPRGKRAVRRKGKRRCVRRCRRGKRLVRRKGKLRCVKVKKRKHSRHRRRGR